MRKSNTSYRKQKKKLRRWQKVTLAAAGIFALLLLLLFLFLYKQYKKLARYDLDEEEVTNTDLDEETMEILSGYHTIAVFGVDARNNETLAKGTLADTNMICCVNYDTGEIRLISVYRDTYLDVTGNESFNKLNYAYAAGGPAQAMRALNRNLDLNITDFVTLNWKAVADGINLLGGVEVEITKSEFAYINGFITETVNTTGIPSVHLTAPGLNHLDGVQAVAYCRLRLMDTDYRRTERQRLVITLALEKAKQADLRTLLQLIDVVFPQTLTSLDDKELITIARNINKFHIGVSEGFPIEKTSMRMGSKGDCVIPIQLSQDVSTLHRLLYDRDDYEPSSVVKRLEMLILQDIQTIKNRPAATTAAPPAASSSASEDWSGDGEETLPVETSPEESTEEGSTEETGETGSTAEPGEVPSSSETTTAPTEEVSPPVNPENGLAPEEAAAPETEEALAV